MNLEVFIDVDYRDGITPWVGGADDFAERLSSAMQMIPEVKEFLNSGTIGDRVPEKLYSRGWAWINPEEYDEDGLDWNIGPAYIAVVREK